jgi:hypothetical protein
MTMGSKTMLRALLLSLVLANALFFAWSHGLLAAYGLAPEQQSEPQRLQQQIHPEMLVVLTPEAVAAAAAAASAASAPASAPAIAANEPTECLVAGLFDAARGKQLSDALAALPAGSWSLDEATDPGRWIVYMGRYQTAEFTDRKKAELRGLHVKYEAAPASLEPGILLGRFDSEAAANKSLGDLAQRGVRTAKVVVERPEQHGLQLRLPAVDAALKTQLDGLKTALAGKPLRACPAN